MFLQYHNHGIDKHRILAQFPFDEESKQRQLYYTLIHQKPFLGGDFNTSPPEQYTRITPVMDTFPSRESVDVLRELGVTYVVVDSSRYEDYSSVDGKIQSFGLPRLHVSEAEYVYGLSK